jgi:putative transposase
VDISVLKAYKYRIYPNREIEQKLLQSLDTCRWLYNRLLEILNRARDEGKTICKSDTQNLIPLLKTENPDLGKVYSKVLQMVNYTPWANISALAALKKKGIKVGHLRFRGPGWYKTLNYNQSGFKLDPDGSILHLSKIGDMKINLHRAIDGTIKAVVIKRSGKQWYAVFQVDQEPEEA